MNLDDSRIRTLVLAACPGIEPRRLEVNEVNYGDLMGFWHRKEDGSVQSGNVIALHRTEAEVAGDIAGRLLTAQAVDTIVAEQSALRQEMSGITDLMRGPSPYEGKRGKHPANCTCSTHLKARSGATQ